MIEEFIKNFKIAGGEVLDTIPKDFYQVKAEFAVAENGAVWVLEYTKELFLSENVIAILDKNKIYNTMHDVMDLINSPGVFISGPSKTADVESFLVFGAHGPKRFAIFFKS
jgi:L-lactate dehydrogenase complex protein LldG